MQVTWTSGTETQLCFLHDGSRAVLQGEGRDRWRAKRSFEAAKNGVVTVLKTRFMALTCLRASWATCCVHAWLRAHLGFLLVPPPKPSTFAKIKLKVTYKLLNGLLRNVVCIQNGRATIMNNILVHDASLL